MARIFTIVGLLLAVALAACTQLLGIEDLPPEEDDRDAAMGIPDSQPADGSAADAVPADAQPPAGEFCDPADPTLVGCFRFEDTVADDPAARLEVIAEGVGFDQGVSGRAAVFTAGSDLHISETPALDLAAFTIEMWVRPDALPVDPARAALLDNDVQYNVIIFGGAEVRCRGNGDAILPGALTVGVWTHVACVHDGQSITLYIDGVERDTATAGPPATSAGNGTNIGSDAPNGGDDFLGRIDELRVWNRARTPDEICEAAACAAP
jgi:hypothetical protein